MNKFGRGYFGFSRIPTLVGIILFALAIGATSGGANSVAATSMPQAQPTTPHEPPEPDVESAREAIASAQRGIEVNTPDNQQSPTTSSRPEGTDPISDYQDVISSSLHPSTIVVPRQLNTPDNWQRYHDEIWNFELMYPPAWTVQNLPWRDFGVRINSPDLIVDELGQPIKGAFISITASNISVESWRNYLQEHATSPTILQADETMAGRLETASTVRLVNGHKFFEHVWFSPSSGSFHSFSFVEAGDSGEYFTTAELIFNSIKIIGDAGKYPPPDYESLGIDLSSFSVSIKHAFQAGQGKIIADQNAGSHFGGDDYALDLCEGSDCTQGIIGQYVVAPVTMKLIASRDNNGIVNDPLDFHFFEVANDGNQRLCMSFAHFQIRLPGLTEGKSVPQGALIGTLIQYSGYSDLEHLHMGLYTVESSKPSCLYTPRTALPFTNNLKLDGKEYPPNQSWKGEKVTSTNYPFCAAPYDASQGQSGDQFMITTDLSGCFGDDPPDDTTPPSASGFSASVANGRTAEITTSGVQDNNGGSGIKEVRFSAKWGGNWYGIGTDSSAPYTLTWDMCSSGVSNGDVELGMEVWDNANNKWVWSEHYGNPHITKDSACGGSGDPQPGGEWHANFWMNKYLAGYVNWDVYYLWDDGKWPYIWFDWGINGPKEGWSGDEFSLRIWRNVYFPGGRYEFRTESDDGVRVYVDGQIVIDHWWDANTGAGGGKDISSGWHEVKVEYYENTGNARLYVYWYGPGYPQPDYESPGGRISSPIHLSAVNTSPLTIWAEAWDDASGVDFVRFMAHYCQGGQCGWHELGTDRNAPYNYSWDWSAAGEQHVWLTIDVADKTGKVTYDPGGWVEVDLDKTSPSAEIITPASGAYLTGNNVQILALAGDSGSGVGSVQFFAGYADGSGEYWHDLGFDTNGSDGWNKSWDVSSVNDQRDVSFFVYAFDRANNYMGTATWATVLDRVPPTSAVQSLPATSPASFTVQWSGSDATSGVAGFDIDYQQDGGSWTRWRTGITETSATFDGANGHTYGFRSRAIDMAGHVEAWPSSPDALTTVSVVQPPQSPVIITPSYGTTFVEGEAITLSWKNTATATEYYGEISGGPAPMTFGWQSGTSVNIGAQWPGYEYYWRVKARNSGGEGGYTDKWLFTVIPKAPTNVSASAPTCTSVKVTWTDNSGSEDGYKIYRDGVEVGSVGAGETSYTNQGLQGQTNYNYIVRSHRNGLNSKPGDTASITTPTCNSGITPPLNVQASDGTLIAQVRITWTQSQGATYYELYRSTPGSATKEFVQKRDGQYNFTDDNNGDGTVLEYALKACSDAGCSEFSNFDTGYADMPVLQSINNVDGDGGYTVAWTPAKTASYHEVQESLNDGAWTQIYSGTATSVNRTGRAAGQWCYRVRGYSGIQDYSPWTNPQCTNVGETDTVRPEVGWLLPVANEGTYYTFGNEQIPLKVRATDNQSVNVVEFSRYDPVNETWITIGEDTTAPYQVVLDADSLRNGYNQISAWAFDASGNGDTQFIWIYLVIAPGEHKSFVPVSLNR